ncbi:hypothetical protein HZI30_05495 [Serratia fonticola]|uniref:hypothetical protein n=1 Tax=Serratia fonticola TaxID=47917 RepID=UPI0015C5DB1C|nr:hypothetical protein [Serratia fonticola]NXZ86390.1 hypothetical protein [Serratia fonticola]
MTKVIVIEARENSRKRRLKRRQETHSEKIAEYKENERLLAEKLKEEKRLQEVSDRVLKAVHTPVVAKDLSPAQEPKDDAMNHKVNHAHQRDPRKKW